MRVGEGEHLVGSQQGGEPLVDATSRPASTCSGMSCREPVRREAAATASRTDCRAVCGRRSGRTGGAWR